ncbi:uncharacterized oxidoreductase TM_0325-like [Vanessa tameamea]|uniref:Uncharacterized oxidoreductase TM_0325-like n=1 Tax=Vanessa tameamea TaxID=334116 RepID=A0A8B8IEU9_VANTA|nr:uncharacterized protein LOC113400278 [Vanessa tameamea]
MDFKGKVVLITGASSGIGACCALNFAKLSAKLALVGRNEKKLKEIIDHCENESGDKPLKIIADISIEDDNKRIITETINFFGKIDVLINNAGMLLMAGLMDDITNYDRISATNIRGTYLLTQQAVPHLIKTKGNIVIVSSILSSVPMPALMPYCMTKAALDMFTKCVALEMAPKGVRVNSVNPGPVATNLFMAAGISDDLNKGLYESMKESIPLRKIATVEDIANMVVFLASDSASCITGSFHVVDSGLHLGDPIIHV